MSAKYTSMMSPNKRSIKFGVYIPREDGRKSAMQLNNDPLHGGVGGAALTPLPR